MSGFYCVSASGSWCRKAGLITRLHAFAAAKVLKLIGQSQAAAPFSHTMYGTCAALRSLYGGCSHVLSHRLLACILSATSCLPPCNTFVYVCVQASRCRCQRCQAPESSAAPSTAQVSSR